MSDLSLPNDFPMVPAAMWDEREVVRLAREIAMNIEDLDTILEAHRMSRAEFESLQKDPKFVKMLASELSDWTSATNVTERVKVKSAAIIEDFLPELYARLNDRNEPLMGKAKLLEFIAKIANIGQPADGKTLQPGDRVVVQINLGSADTLKYEKKLPSKVIDHEPQVTDVGPDSV